MKQIIIVLGLMLLVGCSNQPQNITPDVPILNPPRIDSELLRPLKDPKPIPINATQKESSRIILYNNMLWAEERIYLRMFQEYYKKQEELKHTN